MRTTIVSTSKLNFFKILVITINMIVLVSIIVFVVYQFYHGKPFNGFWGFFSLFITFNIFTPLVFKFKNISYDDTSVYYDKKGFEVQIPFEDIKSIEIQSLTGIYSINLITPSQDGKQLLFKTSLWYPINFKKKDEMVNELRNKINKYKRGLPVQAFEQLPSYRL